VGFQDLGSRRAELVLGAPRMRLPASFGERQFITWDTSQSPNR
jgi:hypothetical protein